MCTSLCDSSDMGKTSGKMCKLVAKCIHYLPGSLLDITAMQ